MNFCSRNLPQMQSNHSACKRYLFLDLFDGAAGEQTVFKFAVRSAFVQLRTGENEAGIDDSAGADFAVAPSLDLNDQKVVAVFVEQAGQVIGEGTGKSAAHTDIFFIAPDPDDVVGAADKKSGTPGVEFRDRNPVPDRFPTTTTKPFVTFVINTAHC